MFKSNFLNEISTRGFIYQATDIEDLDTLMNQKNITAYIGFDITTTPKILEEINGIDVSKEFKINFNGINKLCIAKSQLPSRSINS